MKRMKKGILAIFFLVFSDIIKHVLKLIKKKKKKKNMFWKSIHFPQINITITLIYTKISTRKQLKEKYNACAYTNEVPKVHVWNT